MPKNTGIVVESEESHLRWSSRAEILLHRGSRWPIGPTGTFWGPGVRGVGSCGFPWWNMMDIHEKIQGKHGKVSTNTYDWKITKSRKLQRLIIKHLDTSNQDCQTSKKPCQQNVHVKWQLPRRENHLSCFAGATWNTGALSGVAGEVLWLRHCCHFTSCGVSPHDVKDFSGFVKS